MAGRQNAQWYIRYDGLTSNASWGFDPTIPNAGTNYAKEPTSALLVTDGSTSSIGSTTLTSSTGGFTYDMIGNSCIISNTTNRNADPYFWIMDVLDSNNIVLDHVIDDGAGTIAGATVRIGGASANISLPSRVGGETVWIRGNGDDDPSTILYNVGNFYQVSNGSVTYGHTTYRGHNGRPSIGSNSSIVIHNLNMSIVDNLKVVAGGTGWQNSYGMINGGTSSLVKNCIIDQNGYDNHGVRGPSVENCWFRNTGGVSATNLYPAYRVTASQYGGYIKNSFIQNWNGIGLDLNEIGGDCTMNTVTNCGNHGVQFSYNGAQREVVLSHSNIVNNSGAGIYFTNIFTPNNRRAHNNIIVGNAGGGIRCDVQTTNVNRLVTDNYYYNNGGSGNYVNMSPDENDVLLTGDPFVDSGNGNYNLSNTALKNVYQTQILGLSGVTNYRSAGAVEHNDPTGIRTRHPLAR